jgi:hypothetical protein
MRQVLVPLSGWYLPGAQLMYSLLLDTLVKEPGGAFLHIVLPMKE